MAIVNNERDADSLSVDGLDDEDEGVESAVLLREMLAAVGPTKSRIFVIQILQSLYAIELRVTNDLQDQILPTLFSKRWRNLLIEGPPSSGKTLAYLLAIPRYVNNKRACVQVVCVCRDPTAAGQIARVAAKILDAHQITGWVSLTDTVENYMHKHVAIVTPGLWRIWARSTTAFNWRHLRLLIFDNTDKLSKLVKPSRTRYTRILFITAESKSHKLRKSMKRLPAPKHYIFVKGPAIPHNVNLLFTVCFEADDKLKSIRNYLNTMTSGTVIICCHTMATAREIKVGLSDTQHVIKLLTPDMRTRRRQQLLDALRLEQVRVLILVDELRGCDVPIVTHIIHYDLAHDAQFNIHRKIYLQRTRLAAKSRRKNYVLSFIENHHHMLIHRSIHSVFHRPFTPFPIVE